MFAPYGLLHRRLQKLEQPLQSPKIVEVILIGEGEPEPLLEPGVTVIDVTLGNTSPQVSRLSSR